MEKIGRSKMKPPRFMTLVEKSVQASLAAIEIYNKPDFRYREETFSILMLNAWELLLKARLMKQNGGGFRAIEIWETGYRKDGTPGTRLKPKKNRSGNTMTISLREAINRVGQLPEPAMDSRCIENLNLLTEIRDNAVHLHNVGLGLGQKIQEVGSAALKNFVHAAETWFDFDLGRFNFYIMPLAFHPPASAIEILAAERHNVAVRNLLNQISRAERENPSDERAEFNVTLKIELRFIRTTQEEAFPVRISVDPTAIPVEVVEEDIRRSFPWDFQKLEKQMGERYWDFKRNNRFWRIKAGLEAEEKHCKVRYLDPGNPKSGKKMFYSPGILQEFDQHYSRN